MNKLKVVALILADIVLINLGYYLALYLRFEGAIEAQYMQVYLSNVIFIVIIKLIVFYYMKLYKRMWRYAGIDELFQVFLAAIVANTVVLSFLFVRGQALPRSVYVITGMFDMMFVGGLRLSYRVLVRLNLAELQSKITDKKVMIIGAGDAGAIIIKELRNNKELHRKPVVIIDDDIKKKNRIILHVPVLGGRRDIVTIAEKKKIDEIIIALPSASKSEIKEIVTFCEKTKCLLKILPGVSEMIDGKINFNAIRNVQIEDLLGRDEVKLDGEDVSAYITNKKILITGGGGSIGSELARQVVKFKPAELILLDIYENNVYDLQNELKWLYKDQLKLKIVIASVRDKTRIDDVIKEVMPDVIFHAAAHKHVPLMEDNPKAAIKNNVFGTYNVATAAHKHGIKRFVMISTDKAVNPTNVMGATKRLCEMVIQGIDSVSDTEFVAVRFGNVLGSNGSVVPLFKKQIAEQGYVTLTHKDIIRYFMTIPEAARLVIQAGAIAQGGEIFVLDMGEPVKIYDLARDLIKLSGFIPEVDIPIKITGLRPGEKLYEELLMDEEGIKGTEYDKIFVGKSSRIEFKTLEKSLMILKSKIDGDASEVLSYLRKLVPTYVENKVINLAFQSKIGFEEVVATKDVNER